MYTVGAAADGFAGGELSAVGEGGWGIGRRGGYGGGELSVGAVCEEVSVGVWGAVGVTCLE